ncbi:MAG TPA: hypothetical protein VHD62_00880 [Opitutaceae bacterium]|nr:hypothetical protein [Opitutaceae bacterium]
MSARPFEFCRRSLRGAVALAGAMALGALARASDDPLDRVEDALTASAFGGAVRGRLSGTVDLEGYQFQRPAPGFIDTTDDHLVAPRLAWFLDAQLGAPVYFFAQARIDRGFDPSGDDLRVRLDEYALRITPWSDGRFNVQVGKFATVVGTWTARHNSWTNPFITAPLVYENLTGVWDAEALRSGGVLLQWSHVRPGLPAAIVAREKYMRIPVIWGPSYASGIAVSGVWGRFGYAFEAKDAALSSRPDTWSHTDDTWSHPTISGRIAWRPDPTWNVGLSASAGSYLRPFVGGTALAPGHGRGDYRQLVLGQDVSFAWHHLQVWTELYAARFEIPNVGHADTLAYYTEAKYKFAPQLFGALRWNQQLFGTIPDRGVATRWGRDAWRVDLAFGYRFTPHTQLKLQYNLQHGDATGRTFSHLLSEQFTLRF